MRRALQIRSTLCLLILVISSNKTSAQYRLDSWNTDNGLPQNTVTSILQTRDGYLWLTTTDGLVRFDGVRFTTFNTGNTKGLNSNRLISLLEDNEGSLWIATEDGGLTRYRNGSFITYTSQDGLPSNIVKAMETDTDGSLLVSTAEGFIRWQDDRFSSYIPKSSEPDVRFGYLARQAGTMWYPYADRLHVLKDGVSSYYRLDQGLSSLAAHSIYQDKEGNIWIGTKESGLNRFKNGAFTVYTSKDGLPARAITAFSEDRQGNIWIGTSEGGLVRFSGGKFTTYPTLDDLAHDTITAIYEDREGSLWIGTYRSGLKRLTKDVVTVYSERDGLASNNIYPIFEDHSDTVWIGAWPRGLSKYKDGKFTNYGEDGLPGNSVTAISEDRQGNLWVGAYGGVSRSKAGTPKVLLDTTALGGNLVSAILQSSDGSIWLGTDTGLRRYRDGAFTVYTTKDGLAGDDVKTIIEDRQENIWFGTYDGLTCFKDERFTSFTKKDGLASNRVRSLYQDAEGVLWIGTYDGGLSRMRDGRIISYTTRDGLFNNGVFQILEDDKGNLWLSCNLGIYRVSKRELNDFAEGKIAAITSVSYGKSDGLVNPECNGGTQPAGIKTRDGRLWFPTQGGVAIIDPKEIPFNQLPPPVVIETCILDRETVDSSRPIEIRPSKTSLEIQYTGLSFIKPDFIRFKYKLEGLDHDWIDAGTRRMAYFNHLPPGTYTFRVIAANSDGVWNDEGATIQIVVIPPFWRTAWFMTLALLGVAAAALLVYERRVSKLRKAHAAQEEFSRRLIASQENERKRIAAELHDSLGQNLLVIKNLALLGLAKPEDQSLAQGQLDEISSTVSQAIEEVRTIARNLRPYELDRLGLTLAIESIMTKVSGSSAIEFRSQIDPIDEMFSHEAEINLYRIIQEAVNNIIKHSEATEARIAIKRDGARVSLTIRDNGKGFASEQSKESQGATRRGLGLSSIGERVAMLGGKLTMQSALGQGTTIRVELVAPPKLPEQQDDENE